VWDWWRVIEQLGLPRVRHSGQVNVTKREGEGTQCLASSRRQRVISGGNLHMHEGICQKISNVNKFSSRAGE
jgi:hypothetical protein